MRKAVLFLTVALAGFTPALMANAQAADAPLPQTTTAATFSDAQRTEIESIIKDYLTNKHPEVMAQGLQALQQREQESAQAKTKAEVSNSKDKIFNDPTSPFSGNPKANVTIVEFYDYQCGYCKMSEESLEKIVKEDKNVKLIYKDFPILGPASAEAAKASLASVKQGKFQAFHDSMMTKKDHLSSDMIYQVAKDVGLDVDKLKKDMADASVNDIINNNLKLGQDIGVRGTPMFIINDNIYPGALQYDQLKQAVSDARGAEKKS
jgi:protein-disulfide isomerase